MVELEIPQFGKVELKFLVMDYNGTLAVDGQLHSSVTNRVQELAVKLQLFVLTADTFGTVREQLKDLPVEVVVLQSSDGQLKAKEEFIRNLGVAQTAAIGNGRNDQLMLASARVGVAVVLREGASTETLASADIVVREIEDALDLFLHPLRLTATLRG